MRMNILKVGLTIVCAVLLVGCSSTKKNELAQKTFDITLLNGTAFILSEGDITPFISFSENTVSASVGCNQLFANYQLDGTDGITMTASAATQMLCPDELREDEFIAAFNKVVSYKLIESTLSFYDAEGNTLFVAVEQSTEE